MKLFINVILPMHHLTSIKINDAIISFEKGQAIDTTIHLLFIYFSIILQKKLFRTNVIELCPFYYALIQKVHLGFKSDFWARNPNTSHSETGGRMVYLVGKEIVEMQMG